MIQTGRVRRQARPTEDTRFSLVRFRLWIRISLRISDLGVQARRLIPAFRRVEPRFPPARNGFTRKYDGCGWSATANRERLIRKAGYDWTKRCLWVVEAALMNRQKQFVIDGEVSHSGCRRLF